MIKQNWFDTLNQALESEGLLDLWPFGCSLGYGESARIVVDGLFFTIYRDGISGLYERPIHYKTMMNDSITTLKGK